MLRKNNMRIGYFADGPWSHQALDRINKDNTLEIVFICARFDNPDPPLRSAAQILGVPFITNQNINSDEFCEFLVNMRCDLFVSMSFNQIFKQKTSCIPPHKTINCHAGKLPFYKGRNILNWVLINDEREFGVTVHYIDEGIDTGDIIIQKCFAISDADDYSTLLKRSYNYCAEMLVEAIKIIQSGVVNVTRQDSIHPVGFYCPQRREGDENLNWNLSSRDVFNFVRAISKPGPEARTHLGGKEVKINRVELVPHAPIYKAIAGAVLKKEPNSIIVKTGDTYVKVTDWTSTEKIKTGDRFL
jgi:methionyl-tRNA formyltransferase